MQLFSLTSNSSLIFSITKYIKLSMDVHTRIIAATRDDRNSLTVFVPSSLRQIRDPWRCLYCTRHFEIKKNNYLLLNYIHFESFEVIHSLIYCC